MIKEEGSLRFVPEQTRDALTFLLVRHDPTVLTVDSYRAVQIAHILRYHVQRLAENGPRAARNGMSMADGVDISPCLMDFRVNQKARQIDR